MKKKRVLHVIKIMNRAGAETMIMNIFRNIDRSKIEFDFLYLTESVGDYEKEIIDLGGKVYKLPEPNKQGRIKSFYHIYKIMKQNQYDVVHSHIMSYNGFINAIAYFAGVQTRISHSHTTKDLKQTSFFRKVYHKIMKIIINIFSNIKIACGKDAGEYLYGKNQSFIIVNNAIDLDKYLNVTQEEKQNLKQEMGINNEFIIGHVGRFDVAKNQEFFIGVAKELLKEGKKNFKIILVGQGEKFEFVKNKIKSEKLEEYFIMPGVREDIQIFMNIFDIFIMPSLYEGFGMVVVEALAGNNICFLSNRMPKETNIIESRVHFFDLNIEKEQLIKEIYQEVENKTSIDLKKELTSKGFSIKNMAEQMSKIYMEGC